MDVTASTRSRESEERPMFELIATIVLVVTLALTAGVSAMVLTD